jgi:NAD(P)-dependent dehydrogenase (short-subunit alcohol dehydrogenase family)
MTMKFGLRDATVCVTRGASGLGRACAQLLAEERSRIAIIDRRQDQVDAALTDLRGLGVQVEGFALDVRKPEMLAQAASYFDERLGPVSHLVCCAGTSRVGRSEEISPKDFDLVLDVNAKGLFYSCQAFSR